MGLSSSKNKYKTAKVSMSSFSTDVSYNPNEGQADEFTICRLLVPHRIIEHYMTRATLLLEESSQQTNQSSTSTITNFDENGIHSQENKKDQPDQPDQPNISILSPELKMEAHAEEYEAAVLFADISGFSRLAEELNKELGDAANAAEDLSNYVGNSLNKMVEVITDAGGDVIKFAGDAILAVFPIRPGSNLAASTLTACRVALDLLNLELRAGSVQLEVHCGIGAGKCIGYHVGGLNGRWEYFITGPVIEQFGLAEKEAEAKEVVISSETLVLMVNGVVACMPKSAVPRALHNLLSKTPSCLNSPEAKVIVQALGPMLDSGDIPLKVERLASESGNYKLIELQVMGRVKQEELAAFDKKTSVLNALNPESPACAILLRALKCYIPGPVLLSIKAKQSVWSAQFWLCSTLFIRLTGLTYESLDYVNHLQKVLHLVQEQLYDYQGTMCRMIVDDKGTGILAAFGLPPYAQHENDAVRAVKVAMNIVKMMADQFNHICSVGVTSGRVYAGVVGGRTRCEYTLHGSVVNLAARLMVAAGKSGDGVLVNDVVFRGANNEIEFNDPRRIRCKGYDYPIPVYRPYEVREEPLESSDELKDIQLICAPNDLSVMKAALTRAAQVDCGGLLMVEGEAGMGKSRFCRFVAHTGTDSGFNVVRAASYDAAPPYYVWRQILSSILGLKRYRNSREKMLKCLIEAIPETYRRFAPLLKDVFIGLTEDSVETATLTGMNRSEELANLIINILQQWFAKYLPEILSKKDQGIIHMTSNVETKRSFKKTSFFTKKRSTIQNNNEEKELSISNDKGVHAVDLTPKAMKLLGMQPDGEDNGSNSGPNNSNNSNNDDNNNDNNNNNNNNNNITKINSNFSTSEESKRPTRLKKQDSVRYTMSLEPDRIPHVGHMFVCEDVHWMDEASVSLLVRAVCEFPKVLFVFSSRPTNGLVVANHIDELLSFEETVHISLQPFSENQVEEAIKLIVEGSVSVDSKLVKSVYKRVQGHPLFTLELIRMLDNMGKLEIDGVNGQGNCSLVGLTDFTELALPDTVRGLMTGRFNRIEDNLSRARMQQVIKVASVFGSEFPVDLLLDTIPRDSLLFEKGSFGNGTTNTENLKANEVAIKQKQALMEDLEGLEKMGFVARLSAPTGSTEGICYRFEQSMMRQCAYDMLLFEHRRNYHSRIANLLERRNAGCVDLVYSELAQHFFKAEDALKAIEYLEKAAYMHFAAYQMKAAKSCFSRLLRITGNLYSVLPEDIRDRAWKRGIKDVPTIVSRLKKAQWTRFMGEILVDQQKYDTAASYFLSALEVLHLTSPPTTVAGRIYSNFKLNRSSTVLSLRDSIESVVLLEAARIYSCIGSNIEARHTQSETLPGMFCVSARLTVNPSLFPFHKLENVYLFALKYALAANNPEEPGFVVACSNMAATLAKANGTSNQSIALFQIAEKQLSQVTDIKAHFLVRTHLVDYALLECNYSRAELVLKKLIWTAHFHHLRTVQLRGLELMWVIKRMQGKGNDMLAVAAEIREIEPILGLLFEAFGAAELGRFEECARSLEGIRRLNGTVNRRTFVCRLSVCRDSNNNNNSSSNNNNNRDSDIEPGRKSMPSIGIRSKRTSRVRRNTNYSQKMKDGNPSTNDGSVSILQSPRRGGADLNTLLETNIEEFMDDMPKTPSMAAALSHYCLSQGYIQSAFVAAKRGLGYRDGVIGFRMFDYFTMSSCVVAICQAQVLQPSLLGFNQRGESVENILSKSMKVLFRYARMKPCCKVIKKYVRGWNSARRPKTWKNIKHHWNSGLRNAEIIGTKLDTVRLKLSIKTMNHIKEQTKRPGSSYQSNIELWKEFCKEKLKQGVYEDGVNTESNSASVYSSVEGVDEIFKLHYTNPTENKVE